MNQLWWGIMCRLQLSMFVEIKCALALQQPKDVPVHRKEVYEAIKKERNKAAKKEKNK